MKWRIIGLLVCVLMAFPSTVSANHQPRNYTYFDETSIAMSGGFSKYWQRNGGLAQFGYPVTPLMFDNGNRFQWFERARFEFKPTLPIGQRVVLGLLGREATAGRGVEQPFLRVPDSGDGAWFQETGHTLRGGFRSYWEATGGLPVYGFPITEEFDERNPADGKSYAVQYFERNRFEYHPENAGTPFAVQLGLLGRQLMPGWNRSLIAPVPDDWPDQIGEQDYIHEWEALAADMSASLGEIDAPVRRSGNAQVDVIQEQARRGRIYGSWRMFPSYLDAVRPPARLGELYRLHSEGVALFAEAGRLYFVSTYMNASDVAYQLHVAGDNALIDATARFDAARAERRRLGL